MPLPAIAFIAPAIISAIGSIVGGISESRGLSKAKAELSRYYGMSVGEIEKAFAPYKEMGEEQMRALGKMLKDPGKLSEVYQKYGTTVDPLYKYYATKGARGISRQLKARGQYGGGYATGTVLPEFYAGLGARMAGLTEQRVAREIETRRGLIGVGAQMTQWGAGTIAGIYGRQGREFAGIEERRGRIPGKVIGQVTGAALGAYESSLRYGGSPQLNQVYGGRGGRPAAPAAGVGYGQYTPYRLPGLKSLYMD